MRRTKVRTFSVLGFALVAGLAFWLTRGPKPAPPPDRHFPRQVVVSPDYHPTTGSPLAVQLNAASGTAAQDLTVLHDLLGQFTTTFPPAYLPPLGDNQDVVAALTGRNLRKLVFLPRDHPAIDAQGRLLDRWGTPYFFHAKSAGVFDLRSAGPDEILFTKDDVVFLR